MNSVRTEKSLLAVQNTAHLFLSTSDHGKVEYEILGVSDAVYESPKDGLLLGFDGTRGVRNIKLEHQILALPSGSFIQTSKTPKACVNSAFTGKDTGLVLQLQGQAPFDVELELGSASASSSNKRFNIHDIRTNEWPVELPNHQMSNAGRQEVRLLSVRDANGCKTIIDRSAFTSNRGDEFALARQQSPKAVFDVLESASIIAASSKKDVCVGESLDFVLQGSPPFTVNYEWEGKTRPVQVKNTLFSRLAEKPGKLFASHFFPRMSNSEAL